MAYIDGTLTIYSNDGATVLFQNIGDTSLYECTVIENGVEYASGGYAYGGTLKFIGLAREANATTPTYAIGDTFTCGQSTAEVFYIVESLEGSTWYVPSGWDFSEDELVLTNIEGEFSTADEAYVYDFSAISLGYNRVDDEPNNRAINFYIPSFGWSLALSNSNLRITFTGGTDVTNPSLIQWLSTYGIQLKVTDLTNTTWNISPDVNVPKSYGMFSITGIVSWEYTQSNGIVVQNTKNIVKLCLGYTGAGVASEGTIGLRLEDGGVIAASKTNLVISITGGTDIKNPALIAWLSKYGELQGAEEELTTLTIWGATSIGVDDYVIKTYNVPVGITFEELANSKYNDGAFSIAGEGAAREVLYNGFAMSMRVVGGSSPIALGISASQIANDVVDGVTFLYYGVKAEETPSEYGEIHYNGSLLTTIQLGQTVILHTEGLQAATDIVIKNVGSAVVEVVSFSIKGTTYYSPEGMTWGEWCESEYNTSTFVNNTFTDANGETVDCITEGSDSIRYVTYTDETYQEKAVNPTDEIVAGKIYYKYDPSN